MKTYIKSAVLLSLLAAPLAAFAQSTENVYRMPSVQTSSQSYEQAYLDANRDTGLIKVRTPNPNSGNFAGTNVTMDFVIDEMGVPHNIGIAAGTSDHGLATLLSNALSDWRFSPTGVKRNASVTMSIVQNLDGANVVSYSLISGGKSYVLN